MRRSFILTRAEVDDAVVEYVKSKINYYGLPQGEWSVTYEGSHILSAAVTMPPEDAVRIPIEPAPSDDVF